MFHTVYLDERVSMSPTEVNMIRSVDATKDILTTKLREKYEGKCNANGHVRPGSVELLARSMGVAENGQFTGHYLFDCKVKCNVLYPTAGKVIDALVLKINKMGAYAVFEEAIRVLLPRDTHIGSTEFDAIKEGATIKVRIDRSRFQTNDAFIMAVGTLVSDAEALNAPPLAVAAPPALPANALPANALPANALPALPAPRLETPA